MPATKTPQTQEPQNLPRSHRRQHTQPTQVVRRRGDQRPGQLDAEWLAQRGRKVKVVS
jgi:hypothetical protein